MGGALAEQEQDRRHLKALDPARSPSSASSAPYICKRHIAARRCPRAVENFGRGLLRSPHARDGDADLCDLRALLMRRAPDPLLARRRAVRRRLRALRRDRARARLAARGQPGAADRPAFEAAPAESREPARRREAGRGGTGGRRADSAPLSEPELALVEAADLFNLSQHRRTVAGVAKSLGPPKASILPLSGVSGEMIVTVAWEISWYQYRVSPDAAHPVRMVERGHDLEELETHVPGPGTRNSPPTGA